MDAPNTTYKKVSKLRWLTILTTLTLAHEALEAVMDGGREYDAETDNLIRSAFKGVLNALPEPIEEDENGDS